ncbi:hypothetical protein IB270_33175 [Ensifer sp. ENS05]|uniref:hypothetical protein n=1 Tax=Ensifer sp. ENS05 TaxID=2769277 RepID=UPI001785B9FD|nr:hypothetical protein [Ensifer sp. ENS05]MBD9597678.1 hypothetical protein [Ensifer sp. ENS05]
MTRSDVARVEVDQFNILVWTGASDKGTIDHATAAEWIKSETFAPLDRLVFCPALRKLP